MKYVDLGLWGPIAALVAFVYFGFIKQDSYDIYKSILNGERINIEKLGKENIKNILIMDQRRIYMNEQNRQWYDSENQKVVNFEKQLRLLGNNMSQVEECRAIEIVEDVSISMRCRSFDVKPKNALSQIEKFVPFGMVMWESI